MNSLKQDVPGYRSWSAAPFRELARPQRWPAADSRTRRSSNGHWSCAGFVKSILWG